MKADDYVFATSNQSGLNARDYIAVEMAKAIITVDWANVSMTGIVDFAYRMADMMIERSRK